MPKSAFVTGATGFIGLNLIEELLRQGWQVTAMHRASSELGYLRRFDVQRVEGDVTDAASVRDVMPPEVDVVFHVAGDTSHWSKNDAQQNRVNIEGTRNTVEAALARRAGRFIHTSSVAVFGIQRGRLDEHSPRLGRVSPVNYQRSKFFSEEEVLSAIGRGLDAVILNPGAIVGPYDLKGYAKLFLAVDDGTLPGVPRGSLSFADAREVVRAHVAAAERSATGERYVLAGTNASLLEFVREIGAVLGKKVPRWPLPALLAHAMAQAGALRGMLTGREPRFTPEMATLSLRNISCDCTKAIQQLGYRIVPLHPLIADFIEWLRAEGMLSESEPGRPTAPPIAHGRRRPA